MWHEKSGHHVPPNKSHIDSVQSLNEKRVKLLFNPLYTVVIFHCYMLDESICHFRNRGSILSPSFFFFFMKILLANNVDPDQKPEYVAPCLGLHC